MPVIKELVCNDPIICWLNLGEPFDREIVADEPNSLLADLENPASEDPVNASPNMSIALDRPAGRKDTDLIDPAKPMARVNLLLRKEAVWIAPFTGRIKVALAASRNLVAAEPTRPRATAGRLDRTVLQETSPPQPISLDRTAGRFDADIT